MRFLKNPLPPLSSTTIQGIAIFVGCGVGVLLHLAHMPLEEAALAQAIATASYLILHPQLNHSIPVSEAPPHAPLTAPEIHVPTARPDVILPGLNTKEDRTMSFLSKIDWLKVFDYAEAVAGTVAGKLGGKAGALTSAGMADAVAVTNVVLTKGDPAAIATASAAVATTMQSAGVSSSLMSKIAAGEALVADYAPVVGAMVTAGMPSEAAHVSQGLAVLQGVNAGFASVVSSAPPQAS